MAGGTEITWTVSFGPKYYGYEMTVLVELTVRPGSGHFPWLDDPRWLERTVTAFLDAR
ncbi:hypothetical protein [Actinophytocola sp.]|uniref:hypothetical protein n=1 Tax=Actinophytocola sp. TaxID=1872138 RepID=UPI0025B8D7FA|nr:hypothetical protein [Actinophytocola sp.]